MWQKLDVLREKKLFCNGKKFEKVLSASENCSMVIRDTWYSMEGSIWIESQSVLIGKHIHHALCGHGGEGCVKIGNKGISVDGHEPETRKIYQYHGC